jgi:hypothetical protein
LRRANDGRGGPPRDTIEVTPHLLNSPLVRGLGLNLDWRTLLEEFPDRFMIGTDHFYAAPYLGERRVLPPLPEPAPRFFVNALPPHLAAKIARENAAALYKVGV